MPTDDKKAIAVGAGLAVAAALIWALRARAQPDKAILYGTVIDAVIYQPIKDIEVECNGYTGKTNAAGEYRIKNIEPGIYPAVTFTDPYGRYKPATITD